MVELFDVDNKEDCANNERCDHKEGVCRYHDYSHHVTLGRGKGLAHAAKELGAIYTAHKVECGVDGNGVKHAARAHVDKAQQNANGNGIKDLIEVAVHKPERQARNENGGQVSIAAQTVDDRLAEKELFKNGRQNANKQQVEGKGSVDRQLFKLILNLNTRQVGKPIAEVLP